ncbi:MAG: sulfotransferase [Pseudomonadota bacterium]
MAYSFWSRVIHRVALASPAVAEVSFDIERAVKKPDAAAAAAGRHVFVTGLARAGTTILMRQIYAAGGFRSLTYRDMPFVLAPNLWAGLSGGARKDMQAEERAHGDRLTVDFDSPEALEEVFWRVASGERYIHADRLTPMQTDCDIENAFREYVALVLMEGPGARYLSKNNNNLLRLGGIASSFPNAHILIPFREPLQHAHSLLRQHRNFTAQQNEDPFVKSYMTWLVHHEFGADHRPFVFDGASADAVATAREGADGLEYWLRQWVNVYGFLLRTAPENCVFLSYEALCENTEAVWGGVCEKLGLPLEAPAETLTASHKQIDRNVPDVLLREAEAVRDALLRRASG